MSSPEYPFRADAKNPAPAESQTDVTQASPSFAGPAENEEARQKTQPEARPGADKTTGQTGRQGRQELSVSETMPPNFYSRLFSFLSFVPFLWLLLILAAQTVFSLDARDLWFSDEVRHGNAFQNLLAHGKWLILEMNGQPYPDKPPLYFLFLQGLHYLIKVEGPVLYLGAAAVSGALYLLASLALGKSVAGVDKRTRFAAGLILLLCAYVYGTMHYARMDLLFSALILAAHVFFYKALSKERATASMLLAFLFSALAVLTKGPLGLILPLASGIIFRFWIGCPRRLLRRDVLLGLILFALLIGAWVGAIIWQTGGTDYFMQEILGRQVAQRAVNSFAHREPWHYYFIRLPLAWLPWTLAVFFLPWHRFLGKEMRQAVADSRTPKKDGLAYLWIMFLSGFVLLTAGSGKIVIYFLPIFPAMAILTARAILQMTRLRAAGFRWTVAAFLLIAALALIWATLILMGSVAPPQIKGLRAWPPVAANAGFLIAVVLLIASAWMAFGLKSSRPEGVLMVLLVANLAFTYPLCNMLAPALDPIMSPKGQALVLKSFTDQGYYPASYREYSGTWTYYSGVNTNMLESLDQVEPLMREHPRFILGTRAKDWDKWADKPADLVEVDRRWISEAQWVLAARPVDAENRPVPEPEKTAAPMPAQAPESPAMVLPRTNATLGLPEANATLKLPEANATLAIPRVNATDAPQHNATRMLPTPPFRPGVQPDAVQPDAVQPDAARPDAAQPDTARPDTAPRLAAPEEQPAVTGGGQDRTADEALPQPIPLPAPSIGNMPDTGDMPASRYFENFSGLNP